MALESCTNLALRRLCATPALATDCLAIVTGDCWLGATGGHFLRVSACRHTMMLQATPAAQPALGSPHHAWQTRLLNLGLLPLTALRPPGGVSSPSSSRE